MEQIGESRQERLVSRLRGLYDGMGYKRFPMRRFEEYALYLANKSFLKSESILTFTNPDGKLMALKPDVTLSIVKHASASPDTVERVYYKESVYRLTPTAREFVEIEQMGVEYMGRVDGYAVSEVVRLALESLCAIERPFVMDVSHVRFAAGLMDAAGLSAELQSELFALIRQKNAHELRRRIEREDIKPFYADRIAALADLSGSFEETLAQAEAITVSGEMEQALTELRELYAALSAVGFGDRVRLDFSIVNDLDYYNGIVFHGYVEGVPRAVLSGGRYDNLMRRFGKAGDGIGFALYLDELKRILADAPALDADVLALYAPTDDVTRVNAAVFDLTHQGLRVFAATDAPAGFHAGKVLRFDGEAFREVTADA